MGFDFFIGIDVSKNELDFAVQQGKCFLFHREIPNEPLAIKMFVKELSKLPGFSLASTVFCMEHTGIYNNHLLSCLHQRKTNICLESAIHIKKSLGNIRGKNDKIDAIRIAGYAYEKREKLRLWAPKRDVVLQLAHLTATRTRLVEARKMLKTPLGEHEVFSHRKITRQNTSLCKSTFKAIDIDLKKTEKAIDELIASDPELERLFSLTTSVTGIGKVTAAQIIITSNEFKNIDDPKQYASYSGVAPFIEESGIFKGKGRVSPMANKKVKTLLHMSALVAIQCNAELKTYYQRKISQDKKNKMSVINAVRNKLILRVFACVNQNRPYEINYQKVLA
jgi:transposase